MAEFSCSYANEHMGMHSRMDTLMLGLNYTKIDTSGNNKFNLQNKHLIFFFLQPKVCQRTLLSLTWSSKL